MQRQKSDSLHTEALEHLVGGVNSPVRAFKSVHGNPIYFEKASGALVTDVDGNELVDFVPVSYTHLTLPTILRV